MSCETPTGLEIGGPLVRRHLLFNRGNRRFLEERVNQCQTLTICGHFVSNAVTFGRDRSARFCRVRWCCPCLAISSLCLPRPLGRRSRPCRFERRAGLARLRRLGAMRPMRAVTVTSGPPARCHLRRSQDLLPEPSRNVLNGRQRFSCGTRHGGANVDLARGDFRAELRYGPGLGIEERQGRGGIPTYDVWTSHTASSFLIRGTPRTPAA